MSSVNVGASADAKAEALAVSPPLLPSRTDLAAGSALLFLGAGAGGLASGFDAISRTYPLVLGVLLASLGGVLIVQSLIAGAWRTNRSRAFTHAVPSACAIVAAWVACLAGGLGFVLPTFAMQWLLMRLGGVGGPVRAAIYAALVSAAGYTLFAVALGVRLPATLVPWLV